MSARKRSTQTGDQESWVHKKLKSSVPPATSSAPTRFRGHPTDAHQSCSVAPATTLQIRQALLSWYDLNHRVLPWRRNPHSLREPSATDEYQPVSADISQQQFLYFVWVCEIMSQQTQVPRVAQYFTRWVSKWPTVQELAVASQEEVNDMWAGLGYYRRARYLLEGAQYVQNKLGGQIPVTAAELQKIPGVGPYTGNAIASIAGNERVAVVDANVVRVLARLHKLTGDTKGKEATKQFAGLAHDLVDPDRPGCFNQAMMELGACVCTVHQPPTCSSCPISQHCKAYADVQQFLAEGGSADDLEMPHVTQYPTKAVRADRRKEHVAVCVLERAGSSADGGEPLYLLVQRPAHGLLAGLWQFPSQVLDPAQACKLEDRRAASAKLLQDLTGLPPAAITSPEHMSHLGVATHTFSHIQHTMYIDKVTLKDVDISQFTGVTKVSVQWIKKSAMNQLGLSSGVKKVWKMVNEVQA